MCLTRASDVYKRQDTEDPTAWPIISSSYPCFLISCFARNSGFPPSRMSVPVSYTHLDMYKRQTSLALLANMAAQASKVRIF